MKLSVVDVVDAIAQLPGGSRVLDCGCFGWRLAETCATYDQRLIGLDRVEPPWRPSNATFAKMDGPQIDLPDDIGDLVVASHVLEHIPDAVTFFTELVRVTAPGGLLWVEAPSELSCNPTSSDDPTDHAFHSFWDDPTHLRPHTPGSLYRLAICTQCQPLGIARTQAGDIPSVRMLARKPLSASGRPQTTYVSLLGVAPGLEAAWRAMWPGKVGEARVAEMGTLREER
jgi:SAM-dependent methyltransferase